MLTQFFCDLVTSRFKIKWLVLIISFSLNCMELNAQSAYYEHQAKSHQSGATYYVKQAQGI